MQVNCIFFKTNQDLRTTQYVFWSPVCIFGPCVITIVVTTPFVCILMTVADFGLPLVLNVVLLLFLFRLNIIYIFWSPLISAAPLSFLPVCIFDPWAILIMLIDYSIDFGLLPGYFFFFLGCFTTNRFFQNIFASWEPNLLKFISVRQYDFALLVSLFPKS